MEQQGDHVLEIQDLELLAIVNEELANQTSVKIDVNKSQEDITTIQVIEEGTTFCETFARHMFVDYQLTRNRNIV